MAKAIKLEELLRQKEREILDAWIKSQLASPALRQDLMSVKDLQKQSTELLRAFVKAISSGNFDDILAPEYKPVLDLLKTVSRSRVEQGFSASETATYIFSLKDTLYEFTQEVYKNAPEALNAEIIRLSRLLDKLGLFTFEEYARGREDLIKDQQDAMMELSSPIVTLWEDILAVPVIGTLDSRRTQMIMENLLKKIVDTGSKVAIIDITGVGVVDTLVATHLLKTVNAIRLLGAETVVTGIRPEVAQTIVHLGVDLGDVLTKASLADGLAHAFKQVGRKVIGV